MEDQGKYLQLKPNRRGYLNINLPDIHKLYLKDKRVKKDRIESITDYRDVIQFLFKEVWHRIFKEGWIFNAPARFGQFYVKESGNTDGFYIDWKATKAKGEIVKKYNLHTSGKSFYIRWSKILCRLPNQLCYQFNPCRGNSEELIGSRGLSSWVKKCAEDPFTPDFRGHII